MVQCIIILARQIENGELEPENTHTTIDTECSLHRVAEKVYEEYLQVREPKNNKDVDPPSRDK